MYNLKCVVCGKEFTGRYAYQKICSDECFKARDSARNRKNRQIKNPPKKATCPICGKEFVSRYQNQITCSTECQKERKRRQVREYQAARYVETHPLRKIKCPICGKEFETRRPNKSCCSKKCSNRQSQLQIFEYRRRILEEKRLARAKPLPTDECRACGRKFKPSYKGEKFCSMQCLDDFWTEARKDALARFIMGG